MFLVVLVVLFSDNEAQLMFKLIFLLGKAARSYQQFFIKNFNMHLECFQYNCC